ncbi:MAG: hypothetical protein ACK6D4_04390 [Planctomyces sp.]
MSVFSFQLGARDGDGDAGRDEADRDEARRGGRGVAGTRRGRGGAWRAGQSTAEGAGAVPD